MGRAASDDTTSDASTASREGTSSRQAAAAGQAPSQASSSGAPHPLLDPESHAGRVVPPAPPPYPMEEERLDGWGFRDTGFAITPDGAVELTGTRYSLAGAPLPDLLPWMERTIGLPLPPEDRNEPHYPPAIPESRADGALCSALEAIVGADGLSLEPATRLRHGHGHTQEDIWALRHGAVPRVPDAVLWPRSEDEVVALVDLARERGLCVVPFGGGTNVTEALRCPEDEERPILALDLRRMDRILWLDPVNRMACIQAGAVGRRLLEQLAAHGFTIGHEPDSVEFSTLGGWIATHASGMKKNRYGNIEDIVLDLRAVTARGIVSHAAPWPRESVGIDPRLAFFGSEGSLGIVTQATVRLFPLPEVRSYGSVIFRSFDAGVAFLYDLQQEATPPASARLMDNLQFQFGQALKPRRQGFARWKSSAEKLLVTKLLRYDPERMTACTLVFEGSREEVKAQEAAVYRLARRHGGMKAGGENGERGYQLTFGIAYIRDFVMDHWILGESFETSVPWDRVIPLCSNVKRRIHEEHQKRGLPGRPFVTCRVTQVYPTGVCIYFYFAIHYKGVKDASAVYAEMERAARDEVLRSGGSLSHHHGVGKLRERFLPRVVSEAGLHATQALKQGLDPDNVFAIGNQRLARRQPPEAAPAAGPGSGRADA